MVFALSLGAALLIGVGDVFGSLAGRQGRVLAVTLWIILTSAVPVVLIAVVCAVLINILPAPWNLIPLAILVAAVGFFLYYNFLRPGWLPGKRW